MWLALMASISYLKYFYRSCWNVLQCLYIRTGKHCTEVVCSGAVLSLMDCTRSDASRETFSTSSEIMYCRPWKFSEGQTRPMPFAENCIHHEYSSRGARARTFSCDDKRHIWGIEPQTVRSRHASVDCQLIITPRTA